MDAVDGQMSVETTPTTLTPADLYQPAALDTAVPSGTRKVRLDLAVRTRLTWHRGQNLLTSGPNNQRLYLNGTCVAQMSDMLPLDLNADALGVGRHVSGIADPFNGHIGAFRIAHVQLSDGWIEITWNDMGDAGAFVAAGAEAQKGGEVASRHYWQALRSSSASCVSASVGADRLAARPSV
jgi:hypothetical protein